MLEKYTNVKVQKSKILHKFLIIQSTNLRKEEKKERKKEFEQTLAIQKELENVY